MTGGVPHTGTTGVFVGRASERAHLTEVLAGTGPDDPTSVVVLAGEPGVGKSALLDAVLAPAVVPAHARVVRVRGDEAETELDFGLVDQVMGALDRAPAAAQLAGRDPLDVGARLLQLLDEADAAGHVVVAVDDVQVVDAPSLDALTFAARRARGDRLVLLLAGRPGGLRRLPPGLVRLAEDSGGVVELAGLDVADTGALAEAHWGGPVAPTLAARLHELTGGHPLHVEVLVRQHGPTTLADDTARPELDLPSLVLERVVTGSAAARQLLEALSVLHNPAELGAVAALAEVEDPLAAVEELEQRGLVEVRRPSAGGALSSALVAFRHQLPAAAVYADLPLSRRRALHRRAAARTSGATALHHRVAASLGPDPALVADLIAHAEAQTARGALHDAAQHLLTAATLVPPAERETLVLDAAHRLLTAGRPLGERATEIEGFAESAMRSAVLGRARMADGRFREAQVLLEQAWALDAAGDDALSPEVRAAVAEHLAIIAVSCLDTEAVLRWAKEIDAGGAPTLGTTMMCHGYAMQGELDEATRRATLLLDAEVIGEPDFDARMGVGIVDLWSNRVEEAIRNLSSVLGGVVEHSLVQAIVARSHLAEAHLRAGNLLHALDLAGLAIDLLEDGQALWLTPLPHSVAAYAGAAIGDLDRARHHAEVATAYARMTSEAPAMMWSEAAWLRIAEAEGDHAAVVAAGDNLRAAGVESMAEGINHWRATYAESLAAVGRFADADAALDAVAAGLEDFTDASVATELARARAAVAVARGDTAEAHAALEVGLALDPRLARPLPRARLELAAGALHRRQGQRAVAAELLRAASDRLRAIGASRWLDHCERELDACGLRPVKRSSPTAAVELTPRERLIARLVMAGRTNRQVAEELFISVKTVEHHLSRLYSKLGVSTRAQMAATLAQEL